MAKKTTVGVSLPDELARFLVDEVTRTGRNRSEIVRLSLIQRKAALRRYRDHETLFDKDFE